MTVKELRAYLAEYSADMLVVVVSGFNELNWGDVGVPRVVMLKSADASGREPALALTCCKIGDDDYEELRDGLAS